MSNARKARLISTNASTQRLGSLAQHWPSALFRARLIRSRSCLSTAMAFAQFFSARFQFHRPGHDRVVAVPLNKISPTHEGAVFRGASVIVPEIEIDEVDWIREGRSG